MGKRRQSRCALLATVAFAWLMSSAFAQENPTAKPAEVLTQARLRGLSAVDENTAWASGVKGTVIRTNDGLHWVDVSVPGAQALDFRDIHAFSGEEAVVLAAAPGRGSKLFRTVDGGATWNLVLQNLAPDGFYDCMVFEGDRGWMLGDPIDGRYQLFETRNRGAGWIQSNNGPPALAGEAAFAASGTCITRHQSRTVVATGGAAARLHMKRDGSGLWQKYDTGMARGVASAGVFSAAPMGDAIVLVGGDYTKEKAPGNAAVFRNGKLKRIPAPPGYRSGVDCMKSGKTCVAVGPSGADLWDGTGWRRFNTESWDSVEITGRWVWMSGVKGRVGRFELAVP